MQVSTNFLTSPRYGSRGAAIALEGEIPRTHTTDYSLVFGQSSHVPDAGANRNLAFSRWPVPDRVLVQAAKKRLLDVPTTYVPLTLGPLEFDYRIVPDRDLNGAGLLYFANYPTFLDIGGCPGRC